MAYHFTYSSSSRVQFAIGPFNGYTFGALTIAALVKRATTTQAAAFAFFGDSTGGNMKLESLGLSAVSGNVRLAENNGLSVQDQGPPGTWAGNWFLVAATCSATGATPRFHGYNGTTWGHNPAFSGTTAAAAIGATDTLFVSAPGPWGGEYMDGDIVCVGVKKADSTDLQIETLSNTLFSTWANFGFHWLVGFQTITAPVVNRSSPGNGDEIARTSVSLVSDPPGWNWTVTAPGPAIKTLETVPWASVKTIETVAQASIKSWAGVS